MLDELLYLISENEKAKAINPDTCSQMFVRDKPQSNMIMRTGNFNCITAMVMTADVCFVHLKLKADELLSSLHQSSKPPTPHRMSKKQHFIIWISLKTGFQTLDAMKAQCAIERQC